VAAIIDVRHSFLILPLAAFVVGVVRGRRTFDL
jgi:hypothetical protein